VACSQGYTPTSTDPIQYTYACGNDGILSSNADGTCEPGNVGKLSFNMVQGGFATVHVIYNVAWSHRMTPFFIPALMEDYTYSHCHAAEMLFTLVWLC
jgi:hypothetical protein